MVPPQRPSLPVGCLRPPLPCLPPPHLPASPAPTSTPCRHRVVDYIRKERQILDALQYDGIAKLYFTFQDAYSLYLGLEYCPNGAQAGPLVPYRLNRAAVRRGSSGHM